MALGFDLDLREAAALWSVKECVDSKRQSVTLCDPIGRTVRSGQSQESMPCSSPLTVKSTPQFGKARVDRVALRH